MNEAQWESLQAWAERLTKQRAEYTQLVVAERGRGNLDYDRARTLLRLAGYHQDQVDRIL